MVSGFSQGYTKISAADYTAKRKQWQELKEDWQSPEEVLEARKERKQSKTVKKVFQVKGTNQAQPRSEKKSFVGSLLAMVGASNSKTKEASKPRDPFQESPLAAPADLFAQVAKQIASETQEKVNDVRELGGQKFSDYYQTLFPEIDKLNFDPKLWLSKEVFVDANEDVHRKALAGLFTILDKIFTLRAENHSVSDKQKIRFTLGSLNKQDGDRSNLQALVSDALIYLEKIEPFFLQVGSTNELKLDKALAREADHFKKLSSFLKNLQKSLNVLSPKAAKITGTNLAEALDGKLAEKKEALERLSRTVTEAVKRSKGLEAANGIAETELKAKKQELNKATTDLTKKLAEIASLEAQEGEIVERLAEAQGKLSAAEKEAKEKVDAAEETLRIAEQAAAKGSDSQKVQLQTNAKNAQDKLNTIKSQHKEQIAAAQKELEALKIDSETRVKAIAADLEKAKSELEDKAKVALHLGAANKELGAQIEEIKRAQASTKAIDEAKATMANEIEDLKAELESLKAQLKLAKSASHSVDPRIAIRSAAVAAMTEGLPAQISGLNLEKHMEPGAQSLVILVDGFEDPRKNTRNKDAKFKALQENNYGLLKELVGFFKPEIKKLTDGKASNFKLFYSSGEPAHEDRVTAVQKAIKEGVDLDAKYEEALAEQEKASGEMQVNMAKRNVERHKRNLEAVDYYRNFSVSKLLSQGVFQELNSASITPEDSHSYSAIIDALVSAGLLPNADENIIRTLKGELTGNPLVTGKFKEVISKNIPVLAQLKEGKDIVAAFNAERLARLLDRIENQRFMASARGDDRSVVNFAMLPFETIFDKEGQFGKDALIESLKAYNADPDNAKKKFSYVVVSAKDFDGKVETAAVKSRKPLVKEAESPKAAPLMQGLAGLAAATQSLRDSSTKPAAAAKDPSEARQERRDRPGSRRNAAEESSATHTPQPRVPRRRGFGFGPKS